MHHARKKRPEPSTSKREPYPKLSLSQPSARQTSACHDLDLSPSYRPAEKDIFAPARPPRGGMPWPRHPAIQLLRPRAKAEGLANRPGRQSHMDRPRLAGSEDHDTTTPQAALMLWLIGLTTVTGCNGWGWNDTDQVRIARESDTVAELYHRFTWQALT